MQQITCKSLYNDYMCNTTITISVTLLLHIDILPNEVILTYNLEN